MIEQICLDINDPVLKNHKVYGQELLPGLAYIDMLYQIFREHGYDYPTLELRNLSIYNPLIVGQDYNVLLSVQCSENKEGQWQIRVEGQKQHNGTLAPEKILYITAEMHQRDPVLFEEMLDLKQIKQSAKRIINLDEVYEQYKRQELIHTGFMKAPGRIYDGDTAVFIDVSLGQEALPSAAGFMFHPTLIDGSGIGAGVLLSSLNKKEQRLFLPLFYESFCAAALFQEQCVTRIQTSSVQRNKELIHMTMEFFNGAGQKIGELRNFTGKLVRDAGLINPHCKKTQQMMAETQAPELSAPFVKTSFNDVTANNILLASEAEAFLRHLLADRLKKTADQIETQVGYYELGLDSPGLLGIVQEIEAKINAPLSPTLLFEYTTIAELSAYLIENYASKFAQSAPVIKEAEQSPVHMVTPDSSPGQIQNIPQTPSYPTGAVNHIFAGFKLGNDSVAATSAIEDDIAIIGMAGRYPQAKNLREFWINLQAGVDCIAEIPTSRWDWQRLAGLKSPSGKDMSRWGGFIDDPDCFDAKFFRISPREAETTDPQERLFLEACWEAMEDAGYTPKTLVAPQGRNKRRHVGVFVGVMHKDYTLVGAEAISRGQVFPLSLNYAPIANRVSYFCNFHGPSMAIDTLCSSSLTAVHLAIESIRKGESEVALAGGVNLSFHPHKYLTYGMMDMHSSDGYCHTFGEGGDGYVSGEGVGVVLLKPLNKAIQDQDNIYAVIKGSTINHGGTVSGITVPNPVAQADVIVECLEKTGIDPRTISYIEAHGTGTSLGDPIEIEGLVKAFRHYTPDRQFCSIGSVKSNIGHTESAAGISGLHKIALQLHYKTVVPSLHSEELNPYIDFDQSPFYTQRKTAAWQQPMMLVDGYNVSYPRRAGLSSFGAYGSNAHIILEEYLPREIKQQGPVTINTKDRPVIIPLSAKNEERLQAYAKKLFEFLKGLALAEIPGESEEADVEVHNLISEIAAQKTSEKVETSNYSKSYLADMAYTLQVGREAMEDRVAFLVKDIPELMEKLTAFSQGKEAIDNCWRGQVKHGKEILDFFSADQDSLEVIQKWIKKGNVRKMAELWVKGLALDWELFYGETKLRRISLPTYPFARERYWIPEDVTKSHSTASPTAAACLHPLLHQNTSDLSEQRFSSIFTGREFFIADHVLKGQRIMPGVACLEMARAAVEQAAGVMAESQRRIRLRNVVWTQPFIVGEQPVQVHIGLFPEDNGNIAYEIYSGNTAAGAEQVIHSQGSAVLSVVDEVPTLDLKALQAQCIQKVLSSGPCYENFKVIGVDYGPGYQGLEKVYVGSNQVLAKLSLPSSVFATQEQFVLHPSLVEAALQASLGLVTGSGDLKPSLPFALQELEIFGKCSPVMWALVCCSNGGKAGDKVQRLNIDLCDEQGNVCIRMTGLETQESSETVLLTSPKTKAQSAPAPKTQEAFEIMTFEEVWQEQALPDTSPVKIKTMVCFLSHPENQQAIVEAMQTHDQQTKVIFISQSTADQKQSPQEYRITRSDGNSYREVFRSIREEYGEVDAILYLWTLEDPGCAEDYASIVYILQAIATVKLKANRCLLAAPFSDGLERCYLESWIGFERSLGIVLPTTQVAAILQGTGRQDQETAMKDWLQKLMAELQVPKMQSVLYQKGKRFVYKVQPTTIQPGNGLLRSGGTYLITGGCGGLGFLFAEHFAKKYPVNLILTGRSIINAEKQVKIKALEDLGSQVLYVQADVCDPISMKEGLNRARERFGGIHGVIHAAGIEGYQSVLEKDIPSFVQVLEPKIKGTLILDELLQEEVLDFICYFSSSSAILGDFGSCDYAIGNRFLMAYAHYRKEEQRQAKVFSINWPLWKDGGMGLGNEENSKMYLKSSGQRFLEAEEGVAMFDHILSQNNVQHLVLAGQPSRVHRFLGLLEAQTAPLTTSISTSSGKGRRAEMKGLSLEQCLEWDLKEHVSNLLKTPRDSLDREENLADFGFDSISLTEFAALLTNYYGIEITPALFFGYSTLEKLSQHFLTEHQAVIQEFYKEGASAEAFPSRVQVLATTPKQQRPKKSRFTVLGTPQIVQEPIAIIGMSGQFPQARNVDEMWKILAEGQDVVKEILEDRFDWRQYYGDPVKEPGKINCKWCGCIPGMSEFDPLFFEISPREAEIMDPKQRLLLQEAWKALEDAGYGAAQIKSSRIGMFVGVEEGNYQQLIKEKAGITSNHNGILASRLAYFLNLDGPVMAINTACSSGLVAAHQAILSLRNKECDTAIAAGVNLMFTPDVFILMSQAGMLSEDGKCFTFDKRANGMVPGEAVAAVVLKRLSQAEADGDPIYAVVTGSGINYDGKTNGITAPSGVAQTNLLKSVYDQYQINPEEIEYIVTHGTGTKLGDPVEINALYDAFKDYTKKQGYCALTSAKTNFGHTLAPSGLVSLISLVQALRHETIPASLHCEQENDYINWQSSPFYVNKTSKSWPEKEGKRRTGAVSAFGMSGTNAHMVVQSYITEEREAFQDQTPCYLLALSAKTNEALQEKIKDMADVLQNKNWQEQDLSRISYTLLEGRQHFNHRCAIVVQDREDAVYVFKQVKSNEKIPNLFQGKVPRNFSGQKVMEEYAQDLLKQSRLLRENKKKYREILCVLADLYCQGYELPWNLLFGEPKPCRISLPAYPFARERYWIAESTNKSGSGTSPAIAAFIHPLLHQNTSDLSEQRFSSTFTGQEFFLIDHVVKGQRVLPGVAYLEMVRAAVEQAAGTLQESQTGMRLKNVVWMRPIAVGEQAVKVHIGLFPEDSGEIAYEIYSESNDMETEPVVHSQGSVILSAIEEIPALDLQALQIRCNQSTFTSSQCYENFKVIGFDYGPGHRGIEKVYVGPGQVLAKLSLPSAVSATQDQFVMHPSLMDAALQASLGLVMSFGDMSGIVPQNPPLPYILQELEFFSKCTSAMWAVLGYSADSKAGDKVQKFDIDLCDEQGNVCIRMKGLTSRVLEGEVGSVGSAATFGTLMFEPCWQEQAVVQEVPVLVYDQHLVLLCESGQVAQESIETEINGVRCLILQSEQKGIEERFQTYASRVFEEIQNMLRGKSKGKMLVQIVVPTQGEQRLLCGFAGLLKTAQAENPKIIGQLIEIDPKGDVEGIVKILQENSRSSTDNRIRYEDGKRYVAGWREIQFSQEKAKIPWKDRGIYLITGGAGDLGLIFAREIAHKVKDTTLILTGRSPLNEKKQAELKELQALGARIEYKQVDVTQEKDVVNLVQSIQADFGGINGIIHSAGVIRDNFILKKTKDEFVEVLDPKVTGLINLDQASKDLSLDFFILFSSIAGSLGNVGQADYSTANAFMDAYAEYRNTLAASKQRQGRTLSINWPLWKDGGMQVDAATEKLMRQKGMIPIETPMGIRALYQSLASGKDQVMVLDGNLMQLRNLTAAGSIPGEIGKNKEKVSVSNDSLKELTINYVKKILVNELKLAPERLQLDIPFEKYGIDSIIQMNLIRELEKVTGELSKTLLFEHSNIQELVEYLAENHADKLLESLTLEKDEVLKPKNPIYASLPEFVPTRTKHRFTRLQGEDQTAAKQETGDIAIIGVSGRYPMSNTLQELWEHLKAGHNCLTQVLPNRWSNTLTQALSGDQLQHLNKRYYGGFLDQINRFDHQLFEIAPDRVWELSPEIRLFLEIVWETFEDAGYTKLALQELQTSYRNGVGVFVGTMYNQYSWSIPSLEEAVLSSNATDWQIANRTSHFFNLTGPSIAVNSACSSSLTAIHLACESLKQKSCSMAIAGGINLTLDPAKYDALQRINFLGSGRQSKSFGTGDGYIPGEGVGAVLLKPLSQAINDRDRILAVIKSSFVNHSGGRQIYTAPDPKQQAKLIMESIRRSGIDPATISYVESAANGSALGDPIEVVALNNAFTQDTEKRQFCAIGSVKSNLGHLEAASGISQLSKVLLQLKHQTLVPSINATPRNPSIKFERTAFYLQEETQPWKQFIDPRTGKNLPRRSMINSFGAGGAYANIIVEEFIRENSGKESGKSYSQEVLIVFSAKTEWSLIKYLEKMQAFLQKNSSINIGDVAQALQKINHALEYRAAILASSVPELLEKLDLLQQTKRTLQDANIYISLDHNSPDSSTLQQLFEQKDLRQLAQHWVAGATLDFKRYDEEAKPIGIDLPKYAFDHNIEFTFNQDNDDFYLDLFDQISKGKLSKDQFKNFLVM